MPSPKQPEIRREEAAAADRISELPDSILVHILSLLPIEDAIKTEVLSKRWQFLWTYVPFLVFHFRFLEKDEYGYAYEDDYAYAYADADADDTRNDDFVTFVEKTLLLSNCSKIKKFEVKFRYEPRLAPNVNSWTRFAAGKGTEELHLEFRYYPLENLRYELPQLSYTNSYFKALRFSSCKVVPKGVVAWNSLKRLSIGYANLSENVIEKILSGSPVLETLEFYEYCGFSRLHVGNASVKKLILREFYDDDETLGGSGEDEAGGENDPEAEGLEISAPYLRSLEISGRLLRNCRLTNVSSLVDATLDCIMRCSTDDSDDIYEMIESELRGLLESLVHVKSLTLGPWAIEVLSFMEAKGLSSPLLKCECLTLDTLIHRVLLPGISSILKSSHNLETLVMTVSSRVETTYFWFKISELSYVNEDQYWTSQKGTFKCLRLHLKNVNISGASLRYLCDSTYFSFVQFLLSNARVLQRMVISTQREDREMPMEILRGAQKLLTFPRSSPDAQVMFY